MALFHGSIVALITPFKDGKVDFDALEKLVEWHIANGTNAIVPAGTTGECPTLSHQEHIDVVKTVVDVAAHRVPVMAGAGSNNPVEAVYLSQEAQKVGADGLLHVAGYYNRPNQEGLYAHFKFLHDETNLPIFLYNIPGRAVVNILPETVAKLAQLPRIAGIKDATGNLERPWLERGLIDKEFTYLSGEDSTAVAYAVSGGHGVISVTANVAPKLVSEVMDLCEQNEFVKARELQDKLMRLHKMMFREPSPAPAKYAASLLGLCNEDTRLPVLPISQDLRDDIKQEMTKLGLI